MKTPHGAWVVVADGGRYVILENHGDAERLDLRLLSRVEHENPPTREQGSDRPGRFADNGPGGRSAVDDTDWHNLEEARFASELASRLRAWALDGRFDKLIVAADPKTLGRLRPELHDEVKKRLLGEIAKDLTKHPIDKIEAAIAGA